MGGADLCAPHKPLSSDLYDGDGGGLMPPVSGGVAGMKSSCNVCGDVEGPFIQALEALPRKWEPGASQLTATGVGVGRTGAAASALWGSRV